MIKEITNEQEYAELISQFNNYHFSHSLLFYKARKAEKVKFTTYAFYKNDELSALAQVLEKPVLKTSKALLIPFGPIIKSVKDFSSADLDTFIDEIKAEYIGKKVVSVYVDLFSMDVRENIHLNEIIRGLKNSIKALKNLRHADGTFFIPLDKQPAEMFVNFRKDIKYNIKKVEKDNQLEIDITRDRADFDTFWSLYEATQKRKNFKDTRKALYSHFYDDDSCFIVRAKNEGKVVAEVFCVEFSEQNTLITFLSSTTQLGNKLKAPTYLRWKILNLAFDAGYKTLDFFSIDKDLGGHTSFKLGFRGEILWFNDPVEYVVDKTKYKIAKFLSRFK